MSIRSAEQRDIPRMVELSEAKRASYEAHSPVFWRKADNSAQVQAVFFAKLLDQPDWIVLVHLRDEVIDGFIIGRLMPAPPVYAPGGKACLIDDFAVADADLWESTGLALHRQLETRARQAGAVVSITVSGAHDDPKRSALLGAGAHLASEWYVHAIPAHEG
ncbi:MAG: hypothetical protein QM581_02430 [Pseudomonas sp.]